LQSATGSDSTTATRGLAVRYSADSVFISPPLVLDEGQASVLADTLHDAIAAVAAELTV
jgi:adenosylmethionine-8-amino-7-oxononanoate aminotransferase